MEASSTPVPLRIATGLREPTVTKQQLQRDSAAVTDYESRKSVGCGWALLAVGGLAMVFGIANLAVQSQRRNYDLGTSPWSRYDLANWAVQAASGVWGGALYITSGTLGIVAGQRATYRTIRANLALGILGALAGFCDFALLVAAFVAEHQTSYSRYGGDGKDLEEEDRARKRSTYGLCSLSVLLSVTAIALTIVLADLSGAVVCRAGSDQSTNKPGIMHDKLLGAYNTRLSCRLGWAVVPVGGVAIFLGTTNLVLQGKREYPVGNSNYVYSNWAAQLGTSIWAGAFYVISGNLAVAASGRSIYRPIRSTLALGAVAGIAGLADVLMAVAGLMAESEGLSYANEGLKDEDEAYSLTTVGLLAVSLPLAVAATVMCVILAGVAGKVMCCIGNSDQMEREQPAPGLEIQTLSAGGHQLELSVSPSATR